MSARGKCLPHPSDDELNAFLDGEVAGESRERIEEHVRRCGSCAEGLEKLRRVRDTLRALGSLPTDLDRLPGQAVEDRAGEAARRARSEAMRQKEAAARRRAVAAALAVMGVVFVTAGAVRVSRESDWVYAEHQQWERSLAASTLSEVKRVRPRFDASRGRRRIVVNGVAVDQWRLQVDGRPVTVYSMPKGALSGRQPPLRWVLWAKRHLAPPLMSGPPVRVVDRGRAEWLVVGEVSPGAYERLEDMLQVGGTPDRGSPARRPGEPPDSRGADL